MKLKRYGIDFKRTALKDLEGIHGKDSIRIISAINRLHDGLIGDTKKLTNFTPEYRLRIGKFRILFEVECERIIVLVTELSREKNLISEVDNGYECSGNKKEW